jgi:hypothetical protein
MLKKLYFTLIIATLFSCSNDKKEVVKIDSISSKPTFKDTLTKANNQPQSYPEPNTKIKIHQIGAYHEGEVWDGFDKKSWIGLFKNTKGYYLKKVKIKVISYLDEILDDDEKHITGREITSEISDENILLINGISLQEGMVDTASVVLESLLPNESKDILFNGISYHFFAKGIKEFEDGDKEAFQLKNYKLYVEAIVDGRLITQLLSQFETSDDAQNKFLFIGDIDHDGKLDFIIDTTNHYNGSSPTLFLSSEASENQLVKEVADFSTVGC